MVSDVAGAESGVQVKLTLGKSSCEGEERGRGKRRRSESTLSIDNNSGYQCAQHSAVTHHVLDEHSALDDVCEVCACSLDDLCQVGERLLRLLLNTALNHLHRRRDEGDSTGSEQHTVGLDRLACGRDEG